MSGAFINLTADNIADEHLCCIIRSKKTHPGVEAKRQWLSERIGEGHVFRKLDVKGTVFIEYAPLETAWVPVLGSNYIYIYCLWVSGEFKGKGYARELMEYCIEDARQSGKSGVCMLGAEKQKAWLSDQSFAKKFDFDVVDTAVGGYRLLALSFDGSVPSFTEKARVGKIESKALTVFYDAQCPYVLQNIEKLREYCREQDIVSSFVFVDSLQKAKDLPCVFNNYALFYNGSFRTVNLTDVSRIGQILK